MSVKTYDPRSYIATFGGVKINDGLAPDGDAIKITTQKDRFSTVVGIDGEACRVRSLDDSKVLELRVLQSAPINDTLSALLRADLAALNGEGVAAFSLSDLSGTTKVEGKAYLVAEPEVAIGPSVGVYTWKMHLVETDATFGGKANGV